MWNYYHLSLTFPDKKRRMQDYRGQTVKAWITDRGSGPGCQYEHNRDGLSGDARYAINQNSVKQRNLVPFTAEDLRVTDTFTTEK